MLINSNQIAQVVSLALPIPAIAFICHEANRAYCVQIGDDSQKPWDEAEQWQRESAIKGVEFTLLNPNATPADQHRSWCDEKYADGWVHGDVKNPTTKEHPCLVPYDQLPEAQKIKDRLFRNIVDSFRRPTVISVSTSPPIVSGNQPQR